MVAQFSDEQPQQEDPSHLKVRVLHLVKRQKATEHLSFKDLTWKLISRNWVKPKVQGGDGPDDKGEILSNLEPLKMPEAIEVQSWL